MGLGTWGAHGHPDLTDHTDETHIPQPYAQDAREQREDRLHGRFLSKFEIKQKEVDF